MAGRTRAAAMKAAATSAVYCIAIAPVNGIA